MSTASRLELVAPSRGSDRPGAALEPVEDGGRNEARARGVHVAVTARALLMREEALRHDQVQVIAGARHRHVEETALLLDLGRAAGREIGRDAAVDRVQNEHRLPFLALGRMDGGEDEVVLVEQRHAGLGAGGVGRIEGELGEEALAARIGGRDLGELRQIGLAHGGIVVDALEMRGVPAADEVELGRPSRGAAAHQPDRVAECRPVLGGGGRRLEAFERVQRIAGLGDAVEQPAGGRRPGARE